MKGSTLCLVSALALALTASPAATQDSTATVHPPGDVVSSPSIVVAPPPLPLSVRQAESGSAPLAAEQFSIGVRPQAATAPAMAPGEGGVKNFLFGSQKRASRTLLIGGVALGAIGVGAVKGDVGAVMGVAGLLTAIGGLYLAFY